MLNARHSPDHHGRPTLSWGEEAWHCGALLAAFDTNVCLAQPCKSDVTAEDDATSALCDHRDLPGGRCSARMNNAIVR